MVIGGVLLGVFEVTGREEAVLGEAPYVEVNLLNGPHLFHACAGVSLCGVPVAEQGDGGVARVGNVDAVNWAVVVDDRFHGGFPVDAALCRG